MEDSEKQWKKMIERDVNSMLVKGFQGEVKKKEHDSWFDFITEMRNLLHDLKDFFSRNYMSVQSLSSRSRRTSSVPNLEAQNLLENDGGSHHVWEIIESHESIIREQMTPTTREDGCPLSSYWVERNECINAMERRIQDAIEMLEDVAKGGVDGIRAREKRRIPKSHKRRIQCFEEEMKKVQDERDGLCFQNSVTEDIYKLLFRGALRDFCSNGSDSESDQIVRDYLESIVREDIYVVVFQETVKEWKMSRVHWARGLEYPQEEFVESPVLWDPTESLLREDIYMVVFQEMVEQWKMSRSDSVRGLEKAQEELNGNPELCDDMESLLRDDICMIFFQETVKQWKLSLSNWVRGLENPQEDFRCSPILMESLLREEIYTVAFRESIKQWKMSLSDKEVLVEPQKCLDNLAFNDIPKIQEENTLEADDDHLVGQTNWFENVLPIIDRFQYLVDDFEVVFHENLDSKFLRLEGLKSQVDALTQPMASIKAKKLLYEKAFISRSHNLKLAELEVDLLGDEVEALLSLLKRIYIVLNRNATILSNYFEVNGILKSIKIELTGERWW